MSAEFAELLGSQDVRSGRLGRLRGRYAEVPDRECGIAPSRGDPSPVQGDFVPVGSEGDRAFEDIFRERKETESDERESALASGAEIRRVVLDRLFEQCDRTDEVTVLSCSGASLDEVFARRCTRETACHLGLVMSQRTLTISTV
jgi:hypothetical protein